MNRIFVTGDTHGGAVGDLDKLSSKHFPIGKELSKNDYVIILGDFGLIWDMGHSGKQEQYFLNWLSNKPWTTLFIDGNHENHNRLDKLPVIEMFNNPVGKVNDSIYHLKRGYIYTIDGKTFFTFGGGYSIDKARRTENKTWWAREMPSEEEYKRGLDNLDKVDYKVDYILTHTCSNKMFNELSYAVNMSHKIIGEEELRSYFNVIEQIVKRKFWYFGHFHYDYVSENWQTMYDLVKEII